MTREIRFYNRDGKWYADLPDYIENGGSEADCEMIAGADTWLDYLSNGWDSVIIKISNSEVLKKTMSLLDEDEFGATYITYNPSSPSCPHQLWLCNVTLFIFNEFPNIIYYEQK